jgi:hypothetical protein
MPLVGMPWAVSAHRRTSAQTIASPDPTIRSKENKQMSDKQKNIQQSHNERVAERQQTIQNIALIKAGK